MDKTLLFEIASVTLLLVLGGVMQASGLPSWGLFSVAILLAVSSAGLRLVNDRDGRWSPTTAD